MTLTVFTARVSYGGPGRLDVTYKSGVRAFAPSWSLLGPYIAKRKAAVLTEGDWTAYAATYTEEMRRSYVERRAVWDALLARESATLVCYCTDAAKCHRTLLAGILAKLGADARGER